MWACVTIFLISDHNFHSCGHVHASETGPVCSPIITSLSLQRKGRTLTPTIPEIRDSRHRHTVGFWAIIAAYQLGFVMVTKVTARHKPSLCNILYPQCYAQSPCLSISDKVHGKCQVDYPQIRSVSRGIGASAQIKLTH